MMHNRAKHPCSEATWLHAASLVNQLNRYICAPSPLVYVLVPEEAISNLQLICCTEVQQSLTIVYQCAVPSAP